MLAAWHQLELGFNAMLLQFTCHAFGRSRGVFGILVTCQHEHRHLPFQVFEWVPGADDGPGTNDDGAKHIWILRGEIEGSGT